MLTIPSTSCITYSDVNNRQKLVARRVRIEKKWIYIFFSYHTIKKKDSAFSSFFYFAFFFKSIVFYFYTNEKMIEVLRDIFNSFIVIIYLKHLSVYIIWLFLETHIKHLHGILPDFYKRKLTVVFSSCQIVMIRLLFLVCWLSIWMHRKKESFLSSRLLSLPFNDIRGDWLHCGYFYYVVVLAKQHLLYDIMLSILDINAYVIYIIK
jgi:hypothetical protein